MWDILRNGSKPEPLEEFDRAMVGEVTGFTRGIESEEEIRARWGTGTEAEAGTAALMGMLGEAPPLE